MLDDLESVKSTRLRDHNGGGLRTARSVAKAQTAMAVRTDVIAQDDDLRCAHRAWVSPQIRNDEMPDTRLPPSELTVARIRALAPEVVDYELHQGEFVDWLNECLDTGVEILGDAVDHVDFLAWKYRRQLDETLRPVCNPRIWAKYTRSLETLRRGKGEPVHQGPLEGNLLRTFERTLTGRPDYKAPCFNVAINEQLLQLFWAGDVLRRDDAIPNYAARVDRPWWTNDARVWNVATLLREGTALALLVEEEKNARWRLVDRQMRWTIDGGSDFQTGGLPPLFQREMDRRLESMARNRRRKARRHADQIAPAIQSALAKAISWPDVSTIPDAWSAYVPQDIRDRWPDARTAYGLLIDIHRDWPIERQVAWLRRIQVTAGLRRVYGQPGRVDAEPISEEDELALAM